MRLFFGKYGYEDVIGDFDSFWNLDFLGEDNSRFWLILVVLCGVIVYLLIVEVIVELRCLSGYGNLGYVIFWDCGYENKYVCFKLLFFELWFVCFLRMEFLIWVSVWLCWLEDF